LSRGKNGLPAADPFPADACQENPYKEIKKTPLVFPPLFPYPDL
jgi:hypothetical protein